MTFAVPERFGFSRMTLKHNLGPVVEVREADFEAEVLRSSHPVLVAFYAAWSRPCRILEPALDEVAVACAARAKVVKVNADDNPELSIWYDVQSVPSVLFFVGGSLCARVVGTVSVEALLAKLDEVCSGGGCRPGALPHAPYRPKARPSSSSSASSP